MAFVPPVFLRRYPGTEGRTEVRDRMGVRRRQTRPEKLRFEDAAYWDILEIIKSKS
jgi:hypothetical protein